MKIIYRSLLIASVMVGLGAPVQNVKAAFDPFYQRHAYEDGDIEALYAYDDIKLFGKWDKETALGRLKSNAVSEGAETEDEVNEYLCIAFKEMTRKFNLYKSLVN
jgi:hypothetical protein